MKNRTKAASLNAVTMIVTQLIGLVLKFGVQTVFIHELTKDFLGINGLYANVISFLNFADLGIGSAITVALYRPIAENNNALIRSLMRLYKKTYSIIITVMIVLGFCSAPFVHYLIKNPSFSNADISLWFLIYLISTVATYFSAHKRSFLMATQEGYLSSLNDFAFKTVQQVLQIFIIAFFHSYLGFLIVQAVAAVASNFQLSVMVDHRYPNIFKNTHFAKQTVSDFKIPRTDLQLIKKNVVGAISSKLGEIVVFGTDNVVLSAAVGLSAVAQYSNYSLIVQSITSILSQVMGSIVGGIGNLHVTETSDRQEDVLYKLLYLNALLNLFITVGLSVCLTPFIRMWAGSEYMLTASVTAAIILNYSLNQSRYFAQNFISGMGLYWSLRWKSIIEALINLAASIFLVVSCNLGILGVVSGTLFSNLAINVWWEPFIVFKNGLHKPMLEFMKKYFLYESFTAVCAIIGIFISIRLVGGSFLKMILVTVLTEILMLAAFFLITFKVGEFEYLKRNILHRILKHGGK
ncbi:lipopolysaccharide biosynthesis protein [Lacticaseibacillus zhaodongensis]|uniref:lipopolysaccharide biosynthesis protein n=1 Tax=Lacticaseibacillus zhaodongensis TaxID=2668065 RepID=UPI0012D2E213|nr:transporter [Lacticaseibacillus zhaodongensis]